MAERKAKGDYRPKSVAIDLDGTLAKYDGWKGIEVVGDPVKKAVAFTQELKKRGHYIIIHTARLCKLNAKNGKAHKVVRQWLIKHGFAFDEIWTGAGKPIACAYIDDRAVPCTPAETGTAAFGIALLRIEQLTREEK